MMMHNESTRRRESGMTLIEVMVALVIFSVGVLALGALQINAMTSNAKAKRLTESTTIMTDQIERLMVARWDKGSTDTALLAGGHTWVKTPYTLRWNITDAAAPLFKKEIVLSVTWSDQGQNHSVSQTIIRTLD